MTDESDERLAKRLLEMDEASYVHLLDRFEKPLYRFFYYSLHNPDLACDLCNQTFAEFVTAVKRRTFREPKRLVGFIFGIARNQLLRSYRREKRVPRPLADLDGLPQGEPGFLTQIEARDELKQVFRVIEQFDEPYRQVMLLRFVEGLQIQEIAEALAMPANSVKSYVHRSRKMLCQSLSNDTSFSRTPSHEQ